MLYYLVPETITNPAVQSQAVSIALALRDGLGTPVSYWGFIKDDPALHDQAEKIKGELAGSGIETSLFVIKRERGFFAVIQLLGLIAYRLRKRLQREPGPVLVRNLYGAQLAYLATLGVRGASYIVDLRGHTGAEWEMTGILKPGSIKAKLFYAWERFLLRNASSVLCVSSVLAEYVQQATGQKTPCFVIPSCLDKMLEKELEVSPAAESFAGGDRITLAYAGTVTGWNRVESMVAFFKRVSQLLPRVHFLCITTHVEKARESFAGVFLPDHATYEIVKVPHDEIIATLRKADVGLLLRDQSMVNKVASPVKAAEYLAAGLALVVSAGVGDLSGQVRENQLGLVLESLDPETWNDTEIRAFLQEVMASRSTYRFRALNFARSAFVRNRYLRQYQDALGLTG